MCHSDGTTCGGREELWRPPFTSSLLHPSILPPPPPICRPLSKLLVLSESNPWQHGAHLSPKSQGQMAQPGGLCCKGHEVHVAVLMIIQRRDTARVASGAGSLGHCSIWPWLPPLNTSVIAAKSVTLLKANVAESNGTLQFLHMAAPSGWSAFKKAEDLGLTEASSPHRPTSGQEVLWFQRPRSLFLNELKVPRIK